MGSLGFDQAIERLTSTSTVLAREAESVRQEWAPDVVPTTTMMGVLGTRLINALDEVADEELGDITRALEELLEHGADDVTTAVTTGFLEATVSAAASNPGATRFFHRLGSKARDYCVAWDDFTGARTPGLYDG